MTSLEKPKAPSISLEQVITYVLTPVLRLFDPLVRTATGFVSSQRTQRVVIRSFISVITAFSLIAVAAWSYLFFYWIYVPELSIQNPVWFDYGITHTAFVPNGSPPVLPHAKIDLTSGRYSQPLHSNQGYSALLELHVPASERNVDLGNFMVALWLKNADGETVHHSARPAILRYRSSLLRTMLTFYRTLPLLLGFSDESQRIKINLIESFSNSTITTAEITLSTPNLQLYTARLVLDAHLSGLRYLMYYWPTSTATTFIAIFLFWEMVFAISAWRFVARAYPEHVDAVARIMSEADDDDIHIKNEDGTDEGEETEVPGAGGEDEDEEEVPPTPTTTTSAGVSGVEGKDGFETETETDASMSMYGDEYETETEAEGFQEVPRRF